MIKTAVVGYPRIGEKRELKKLVEGYFRDEVTSEKLYSGAQTLRERYWEIQDEAGIDYISCGDFSLYDSMLDMAVMLNVIPERFKEPEPGKLDTYFAMARGYQDEDYNIRALEMKKWFTTNYHYFVPEIEHNTEFELNDERLFEHFREAKKMGIKTVPALIGPFTFLKLARVTVPDSSYVDYCPEIADVYIEIIQKLSSLNAEMVQLEEPMLVTDLNREDIECFVSLYKRILPENISDTDNEIDVLLQTYFGDIRDVYEEIMDLPFSAVGLDFCEGREENLRLIKDNGFPADRKLFAGIINGKNIWRNNYHKTLRLLKELTGNADIDKKKLILNTSCSLLHVPHTLRFENQLEDEYKRYLAFAEEKLGELVELKKLFLAEDYEECQEFEKNTALINSKKEKKKYRKKEVRKEVKGIKGDDFIRKPEYDQRLKQQQNRLKLPFLPLTTIGSFPQTAEVRKIRKKFQQDKITKAEYHKQIEQKIKEVIELQEELGLDVLVHGEFERNDMVEYFGRQLEGFIFTENGWVQSYGTRGVKPPIIFGDISREEPMTVDWIKYALSLTEKPVKGMLTGPVTIYNWSFPREDLGAKDVVYQLALAVKKEIEDLEAAGVEIIQVDEAALREKLPLRKEDWHKDYLDWAIKAFRLATSSVKADTQIHTHMCYSEFADIIEEIKELDADVISFEAARSDLSLLDILEEKYDREVGPGVYDIHSPRVPSVEEVAGKIRRIVAKLGSERVWINPDCGLKTRSFSEVVPALKNMVEAAVKMRNELAQDK